MFLKKPVLRLPAWMNGGCKLPGLMPVTAGISCFLLPPSVNFPLFPALEGVLQLMSSSTVSVSRAERLPCARAVLSLETLQSSKETRQVVGNHCAVIEYQVLS